MVFSNFAQVLYSVLAEGRSFAQFTRNLFLNITDYSDSEENPIELYGKKWHFKICKENKQPLGYPKIRDVFRKISVRYCNAYS